MKFLRSLLATLVGLTIFTFGSFFLLLIIASAGSGDRLVDLKDKSVLHLKLSKQIREREVEDPLGDLPMFASLQEGGIGLMELKEALNHAAEDDKIEGILLETPIISSGISTMSEVRAALEEFKESGKFIYSYSEFYTEGAYMLSSVADEVYLNPDFTMFEFNGLNMEGMYLKGLFDKLEVEPIILRAGDYKEATESFERTSMSPQARTRNEKLLANIHNNLLEKIAESRSLTLEEIKHISDSALANVGEDAVKYGLVDKLLYRDEVLDIIKDENSTDI